MTEAVQYRVIGFFENDGELGGFVRVSSALADAFVVSRGKAYGYVVDIDGWEDEPQKMIDGHVEDAVGLEEYLRTMSDPRDPP